jgi:hypothetical protein
LTTITVRKLNEKGTALFKAYLERLRTGLASDSPRAILEQPDTSVALVASAQVELRPFATRQEAAEHLVASLDGKLPKTELDHGPGVWNWLSLLYFDQLCPTHGLGARKVGKDYRYILPPLSDPEHFRHYYRHLLAGAFRIHRQHKNSGSVLLAGALDKFDDFNEQIASRQEFISNPAIVGAIDVLYYDASTRRPKRGAASNKRRPGTLRRFIDVIQQLDLTYDLYSLTGVQLMRLLPGEFDRWHKVESDAA